MSQDDGDEVGDVETDDDNGGDSSERLGGHEGQTAEAHGAERHKEDGEDRGISAGSHTLPELPPGEASIATESVALERRGGEGGEKVREG